MFGLNHYLNNTTNINGCMVFNGFKMKNGYGYVTRGGIKILTHRLVFSLYNNREIKPKHDICHKCDNPPCINPDHLFEGTRSENMIDAINKNRFKPKEYNKKISDSSRKRIICLSILGYTNLKISKIYNVSDSLISQICTKEGISKIKLNINKAIEIRKLSKSGKDRDWLSLKYNVTKSMIGQILRNTAYKQH